MRNPSNTHTQKGMGFSTPDSPQPSPHHHSMRIRASLAPAVIYKQARNIIKHLIRKSFDRWRYYFWGYVFIHIWRAQITHWLRALLICIRNFHRAVIADTLTHVLWYRRVIKKINCPPHGVLFFHLKVFFLWECNNSCCTRCWYDRYARLLHAYEKCV